MASSCATLTPRPSSRHGPSAVDFNPPVATIQIEEILGIGTSRTEARHRVRNFADSLPADDPRSLDSNRLGKAGPAKISLMPAAALQMANLDSPVTHFDFANLIKLLAAQLIAVGGKAGAEI